MQAACFGPAAEPATVTVPWQASRSQARVTRTQRKTRRATCGECSRERCQHDRDESALFSSLPLLVCYRPGTNHDANVRSAVRFGRRAERLQRRSHSACVDAHYQKRSCKERQSSVDLAQLQLAGRNVSGARPSVSPRVCSAPPTTLMPTHMVSVCRRMTKTSTRPGACSGRSLLADCVQVLAMRVLELARPYVNRPRPVQYLSSCLAAAVPESLELVCDALAAEAPALREGD